MRRPRLSPRALGVVVLLLGGAIFVPEAHADSVGDQQQQVKDDLAEIDRLNQKASQLDDQYVGYLNQKADLDTQIAAAQQQIESEQAQLATLQSQLANVAVQKFTGGDSDSLGPLFTDPAHLNDGLQRDQLAQVAVDAGAATTDSYNDLLNTLDAQQKALQSKQKKASQLADAANQASQQATAAGNAYQAELAKDQAKLGVLLQQAQQQEIDAANAAHAKAVAAAQAKEHAASATTSGGSKSSSGSSSTNSATGADNGTGNNSASGDSGDNSGTDAGDSAGATSTTDGGSSSKSSSGSSDSGKSSGSSDSGSTPAPPPVSSRAEIAVNAARAQLGVPYRFATSLPGVSFDCSGLTAYAWGVAGVSIVHQSAEQYATTPHVAITDVQPGDLLFFYHPISHVAIYIGNNLLIQAPAPGKFVEITAVNWSKVVGASRPG
jgi:cell wall-associated NlpC family hydrolase